MGPQLQKNGVTKVCQYLFAIRSKNVCSGSRARLSPPRLLSRAAGRTLSLRRNQLTSRTWHESNWNSCRILSGAAHRRWLDDSSAWTSRSRSSSSAIRSVGLSAESWLTSGRISWRAWSSSTALTRAHSSRSTASLSTAANGRQEGWCRNRRRWQAVHPSCEPRKMISGRSRRSRRFSID